MGGGGGDNGYEQRQQKIETNKQVARNALNALFGVPAGDTSSLAASLVGDAPDRSKFFFDPTPARTVTIGENTDEYIPASPGLADEASYRAALDDYNARVAGKAAELRTNAADRNSLYEGVRNNAFTAGKRKLDEDQQDAARKLKFELFATGQNGGSGDVDENARLRRTYDQGLIDLGGKADAAKADFRNADEQTRLQLLQSIDNGMDQGSALAQATQSMQTAADKAAADATGTALGDLFTNAGLLYDQSQYAKGRMAGQQAGFQMFPQPMGNRTAGTTSGVVSNNSAYGG